MISQQAADLLRADLDAGNDLAVAGDINLGAHHELFWIQKGLPALVSQVFNDNGKVFTHISNFPAYRPGTLHKSSDSWSKFVTD